MIKLTCLQKKIWKINYFNTLSIHVQHLWYNASTKIRKYFIQNDVSSLYRFSILKSAKKILFTSLNYGLSLRYISVYVTFLPWTKKLGILPPWTRKTRYITSLRGFLSSFSLFFYVYFGWIFEKKCSKSQKNHKMKN